MSYQVLARKWRPRSFAEMVGQAHVLRALVNALNSGRLHHAYLFTGTRGVGKTTLARLLAKCLNCEAGVSATPCQNCAACREIDEGRFIDLIEVDAASRTRVEDTRELLENVQYAPSHGRFKVYLIDEVHMLSGHSFNALLKTLEEPPEHVKFLLATTDPQKLPVTVLSRCLQFNLKRMSARMIVEHLQHIVEQEDISAEQPGLYELARAADGSMRDALSILDQAIAYCDGALNTPDIQEMLGSVSVQHVAGLCRGLAAGDGPAIMVAVSQLAEQAVDFSGVLAELITILHQVALKQVVPEALGDDMPHRESVELLAAELSREDVQLCYQICLLGRRDLPLAPEPRGGFEMIMLRALSFRPHGSEVATSGGAGVTAPTPPPALKPAPKKPAPKPAAPPAPSTGSPASVSTDNWNTIVRDLNLQGPASALAACCSLKQQDGDMVHLVLEEQHIALRTTNGERRLHEALSGFLGRDVKLVIEIDNHGSATPDQIDRRHQADRQREAEHAVSDDAFVQSIQEGFGATIVPGSIKPHSVSGK